MANRNFDSRVIIQRLQNKNYARNLYQQNVDGQRLINNPQNSDGNSSRYVTFVPVAQTDYYRTLAGTTTINLGGTFGISSIPPSTAPPPPSIPGSMYFDPAIAPNGSHVSYPNDSSLAIGTRPFTIEWYQYFISGENYPRVFSIGSFSQESISIAISYEQGEGGNKIYFWKNTSGNVIGNLPPYNAWTHIAIVGTTGIGIKIYQNGVEIGDVPGAYNFTDTTSPLMIGNESIPAQESNFKGNITNFRWVVDHAIYETTFTPPAIPLANIPGTQLLLAVSSELGVVRDSSSANRTPSNTGVIYSPELPIMPFISAPSAPVITSITPGNAMLTVIFEDPISDGGSEIVNYEYSTDLGVTYFPSRITTSPMIINILSDGSPLVNGTTYEIEIRAVNSVGEGRLSNIVSATPFTTPSAPTITSIIPGNAFLDVYFTPPVSDGGATIENYKYTTDGTNYRALDPADIVSPITITVLSNPSGSSLVNGDTYPIQIIAVNSAGDGVPSDIVSATPASVPPAPTSLIATSGNGQLSIAFTQTSNGGSAITNYQYSVNGGSFISSGVTVSPVIIMGLSNGISYSIQLKAVNGVGESLPSSTVTATPGIVQFTTVGSNTWIAPDGVTSIEYLIVGGGGGSGGGYDNGAGGGGGGGMVRSGTTSVTPGTTYTVVVGDGGAAGTANRTAIPPIPIEINGFSGNNSSFDTIVALGGGGGYGSRQPPDGGNTGEGGSAASNPSTASDGGRGGGALGGGGGGGGSVGNGTNKTGAERGFGGSGTSNSISGSSITYGTGGDGGTGGTDNAGTPGAVNTGNGARGGGAPGGADNDGAKGGSGIIIILYTTVPEPPTALSGVGVNQQIVVSFTAGYNGGSAITNYQYTTDGGTTYRELDPADASSPITITKLSSDGTTDLTNGDTYTVRLKAVNANGLSVASSPISVTPILATVPPTPIDLSSVGGDQTIYVILTQTGNGGSAITNYEYSVDGGSFIACNPVQAFNPTFGIPEVQDSTSFTVVITTTNGTTRLTNGTSYIIRLKAVNAVGSSVESAPTTVIPAVNSLNTTSMLVELDANNPASYSGTGTAWTNLQSAGSYSATLLNTPTFDNVIKYFTFDGVNQIAQIAAADAINATVGSSFTAQIWARVNTSSPDFGSFDGVISKQFGPGSYDGYSLSLVADTSVQLTMNGQSVNGRYSSSTGVYSNGWALYTIVVRFGGGSGNPSYAYVSTRRVVTANNSESGLSNTAPLQFPRGIQEGSFNYCPADVGAFYLYNTAVSQEDIIRNYDATKTRYGL
jgi:predicted RNA-binding protein with TRAM domain